MLVRVDAILLLSLVAVASTVSSAAAQSDAFAGAGTFALGAERLFGVTHSSIEFAPDSGGTITSSSTEVSFLAHARSQSPFAAPRVAFDVFAIDGLSIGGFFGVVSRSTEVETESATLGGGTVTSNNDGPTETAIVVGGRVGYALMFNDIVGVWPRLGLSYFTDTTEATDGTDQSADGLALSADALLIVAPLAHCGFTLGPVLDLGLAGSADAVIGGVQAELDTTITDFGLLAGLVVWL